MYYLLKLVLLFVLVHKIGGVLFVKCWITGMSMRKWNNDASYGVNFCFGESTYGTPPQLKWLKWTDELQCVQITNMSLEFVEDASLKLRAARIIMARYGSRPMYKLGSIASNIETLFARMLNLYKEVANLTTVRNKMSFHDPPSAYNPSYEPALENTINALGIAQSHYHRIRLEKKFFYKALKENAKKEEINKKRFLKKFGALPPGFQEPTELKGGMYTEYRRKFNKSSSPKDDGIEPALEQEPREINQRRQKGKNKEPIWKPGQLLDKLQYDDSWPPDKNQQGLQRSYEVAWQPNQKQDWQHSYDPKWQPSEKQQGSRRSFAAAWQPNQKQATQRSFAAAWQPNQQQASQRSFAAAWQPNQKQATQRSFAAAWQPNQKQAMQRSYGTLWQPNKKQVLQRSYDTAWQPNENRDTQRSYDADWQPSGKQQASLRLSNDLRPDNKYLGVQNFDLTNHRAFQEPYENSGSLPDQRRSAETFPIANGIRSKKRVLWKPKTN